MRIDSEARQLRALDALEALEELFTAIPDGCDLQARHVAALFGLAGDAMRDAHPRYSQNAALND